MKCRTIEQLLPLYVENDLAPGEATEVRAHLSSCEACCTVADGLSASQKLLHQFPAPEFDEEFYEQLRGAVLREIRYARPMRPSFFQTFRPLRRQALAAACLVLLVTFIALSGLLYHRLSNSSADMAALERGFREISPGEFTRAYNSTNTVASTGLAVEGSARRSNSTSGKPLWPKLRRDNQMNAARAELVSRKNGGSATTLAPPTTGNAGTTNDSSGQAVARMEIQTSDPNIRIIWLARKSGE